jgi:hypothetical protein
MTAGIVREALLFARGALGADAPGTVVIAMSGAPTRGRARRRIARPRLGTPKAIELHS